MCVCSYVCRVRVDHTGREISADDVQLWTGREEKKTKEWGGGGLARPALDPDHLLHASFHFLFRIAGLSGSCCCCGARVVYAPSVVAGPTKKRRVPSLWWSPPSFSFPNPRGLQGPPPANSREMTLKRPVKRSLGALNSSWPQCSTFWGLFFGWERKGLLWEAQVKGLRWALQVGRWNKTKTVASLTQTKGRRSSISKSLLSGEN